MWHKLFSKFSLADKNAIGESSQEVQEQDIESMPLRAQAQKYASDLITLIDSGATLSYRKAATVQCTCCKENIIGFYVHISELLGIVSTGGKLVTTDTFGQNKTYTLKSLLINDEYYIPPDVVRMLAVNINMLCEQLKAGEGASGGIQFHNTRLLAMQLLNSRDLCSSLIDCYIN